MTCPEFNASGTVWASWASWVNNCWCVSDLKVGKVFCKVFFVVSGWGWVDFDSSASVVWVSCILAVL